MSSTRDSRITGLYGMADHEASGGEPERLAAALLQGGCRLIQYRAKGVATEEMLRISRRISRRCAAAGALYLLNDHPSLVEAAHADGAHIGQTDGDPRAARALLGADKVLGISTHGPEQALEASQWADYIAFGPIFATPNLSRPKTVQGPEALRAIAAALGGRRPLVAIGGIQAHHIVQLRECGADAWAVIGAIAGAPNPVEATRQFMS